PVSRTEGDRIARLIADLDGERFAVRQQAAAELAAFGDLARPALKKALTTATSLEQRRRLEGLLARPASLGPESLRDLRALEVLEYLATPEARQVLRGLADGAPEGWLTRQARAALGRTGKP